MVDWSRGSLPITDIHKKIVLKTHTLCVYFFGLNSIRDWSTYELEITLSSFV